MIFERDCIEQWQEFDDFFYDNPHIAEVSGFMTVLNNNPIGFVSWNPTNLPISVEIGHNCISDKYKRNGYGLRQMQEAVKRIIAQGAEKIIVTTNEILVPAQHTYESAGFKFVNATIKNKKYGEDSKTHVAQDVAQELSVVILSEIRKNNKITRKKIAEIAHVSVKTVEREMKKMDNVHYEGSGRNGYWIID